MDNGRRFRRSGDTGRRQRRSGRDLTSVGPFLALRSYLPADHPDKEKEIGSESTPAEFIDVMLAVTAELRRVLAPHGSICVELGDTYAGSGGAGGDYDPGGWREGQEKFDGSAYRMRDDTKYQKVQKDGHDSAINNLHGKRQGGGDGWPLAKSKALIPQLLEVALAYGVNPLTGAESPAGRWRIRNVVTWARPNPPVGALGDKWRPATSDVIVACVSEKRYWDDLATRQPSDYHRKSLYTNKETPPGQRPNMSQHTVNSGGAPLLDWHSPLAAAIDRAAAEAFAVGRHTTEPLFGETKTEVKETIGRRTLRELVEQGAIDPGDVLHLPPGGYKGSHYAVYPPELVAPLVQAMLPPKVCRTCGEPSRRITEVAYEATTVRYPDSKAVASGGHHALPLTNPVRTVTRDEWTSCGHDDYRPPVILDPFAGSGTTLAVALGHNPDALAIGIDLDERNELLARDRVGPLLWAVTG